MANTKNVDGRNARKEKKREQRKALKKLYDDLTTKQKKAYKKSETVGLRSWLAEQSDKG